MGKIIESFVIIVALLASISLSAQKIDIKFFGHASFMITTESGIQILMAC